MYSKLVSWEVWNFMSLTHAKAEFDEKGIINFKGYNDSGKSAMLTALKVLMCNTNPQKQVGFIQDDKEYFRVLASFNDNVQILRDKYINGQSLYEMYKDGQCIFSTKQGRALTKVASVPQPIEDYLGLITYDGICLNARACFEKQIGVETSGSENYVMFNTVLKSEEIATATALLNNDRNKLAADITAVSANLDMLKGLYKEGITQDMVNWLKAKDDEVDSGNEAIRSMTGIATLRDQRDNIVVIPELRGINTSRLSDLTNIYNISESLDGIHVVPELKEVNTARVEELRGIQSLISQLNTCIVTPALGEVSTDRLSVLSGIASILGQIKEYDSSIKTTEDQLQLLTEEQKELHTKLADSGVKLVKCPVCSNIFSMEENHVH